LHFVFPLKIKRIADGEGKSTLDTQLLHESKEKRRSQVSYASGSASFSGHNSAVTLSEPVPAFETQETNDRSNSRKSGSNPSSDLAEAQAGILRRETLEEIFAASRPKFVAMARAILRNAEDAEDAVQNAFLSAYLHFRSFEGRSALRTWLTRIVLNAALMMQRKRKAYAVRSLSETSVSQDDDWTKDIPASQPDPEMVHAERETLQFIDGILENMKPVLRQAFTMTYYEEFSGTEACAMLGVSSGTFKARLFRARRQLLDRTERALVTPIHRTTPSPCELLKRNGLQRMQGLEL
jgi:RNA polymerase sigma-70 factor, ECF subfamily